VTDRLALSLDVSAVPARPGGAGYYTMAIARGLAARADIDLAFIARRGDAARWTPMARGPSAVHDVVPPARPRRLMFEQAGFPSLLRSIGVQVHHGPHYTMPTRASIPCVVTIHDCTFFDHPEWHMRTKAAFFRRAIRRAALEAGALVCVSQVTAERLHASCTVRAPVVVAPHGVDHDRFTATEAEPGADAAILTMLGIEPGRPLVVFIGTLEPRKGVAPLVAAFDAAAARHPEALLILGGQMGWGLAETERALSAAVHRDRIRLTDYLPDAAVPALLRQATVVAYPAIEEGFGLPALEALACGAPLVTTEGTAMAEMAKGAAQLVSPGDVAMLAEVLSTALEEGRDGQATEYRRAEGLAVAAERTWEASIAQHLVAYEQARSGPH
jgi:glycosyltransferase involved in cell wall biosynthesis